MVAQQHQGDKKAEKRSIVAVLRDKILLVVVALIIVAAGIMTIALVCTWILRRTMT